MKFETISITACGAGYSFVRYMLSMHARALVLGVRNLSFSDRFSQHPCHSQSSILPSAPSRDRERPSRCSGTSVDDDEEGGDGVDSQLSRLRLMMAISASVQGCHCP